MRTLAVVVVGVLLAVLAGCSDRLGGAEVANAGYIAGDGTVRFLDVADRDEPVSFSGTTLDGAEVDLADTRGDVVVVNVWASWCPPCVKEAPALQKVWEQHQSGPVKFVGINFKDNAAAARAHERRFGVTYPSIEDQNGKLLLSLRGTLPPQAIPSTLVLDRDGRVAARVLGEVTGPMLRGLVEDVLAESTAAAAGS